MSAVFEYKYDLASFFDYFNWINVGHKFANFEHLLPGLEKIRFQKEYFSPAKRELTNHFKGYLVFVGCPEVALEKDINERILLLKELKNAFLKRDIDEEYFCNFQ